MSSLDYLPADVFSLLSYFLSGFDITRLYFCCNNKLNIKLDTAITNFSLTFRTLSPRLKWPSIIHRLQNLTLLSIRYHKTFQPLSLPGVECLNLPPSLTKLRLRFAKDFLYFHEANTAYNTANSGLTFLPNLIYLECSYGDISQEEQLTFLASQNLLHLKFVPYNIQFGIIPSSILNMNQNIHTLQLRITKHGSGEVKLPPNLNTFHLNLANPNITFGALPSSLVSFKVILEDSAFNSAPIPLWTRGTLSPNLLEFIISARSLFRLIQTSAIFPLDILQPVTDWSTLKGYDHLPSSLQKLTVRISAGFFDLTTLPLLPRSLTELNTEFEGWNPNSKQQRDTWAEMDLKTPFPETLASLLSLLPPNLKTIPFGLLKVIKWMSSYAKILDGFTMPLFLEALRPPLSCDSDHPTSTPYHVTRPLEPGESHFPSHVSHLSVNVEANHIISFPTHLKWLQLSGSNPLTSSHLLSNLNAIPNTLTVLYLSIPMNVKLESDILPALPTSLTRLALRGSPVTLLKGFDPSLFPPLVELGLTEHECIPEFISSICSLPEVDPKGNHIGNSLRSLQVMGSLESQDASTIPVTITQFPAYLEVMELPGIGSATPEAFIKSLPRSLHTLLLPSNSIKLENNDLIALFPEGIFKTKGILYPKGQQEPPFCLKPP